MILLKNFGRLVNYLNGKWPWTTMLTCSIGVMVLPFVYSRILKSPAFGSSSDAVTSAAAFFDLLGLFTAPLGLVLICIFAQIRLRKNGHPKGQILATLLPPDAAEERILALDVAYDRWLVRYGPMRARRIYCVQSFGTVIGFWIDWLLQKSKLLDLVEKWLTKPSS